MSTRKTLVIIGMVVILVGLIDSASAMDANEPATQDNQIRSRSDLTVLNYGGGQSAGAYDGAAVGDDIRALLDFDLPGDLAGQLVKSAKIRMEMFLVGTGLRPLEFRRLTQDWVEGDGLGDAWIASDWDSYNYTIPGDNGTQQPWPGGAGAINDSVLEDPTFTPPAQVAYQATGTFWEIDVTNSIQSAANGEPFEGFLIRYEVETDDTDSWFAFWSTESSNNAPVLLIDYGPPANCAEALAAGFSLLADLNSDCFVNLADFAMFASQWLQCIDPSDQDCDEPWAQ